MHMRQGSLLGLTILCNARGRVPSPFRVSGPPPTAQRLTNDAAPDFRMLVRIDSRLGVRLGIVLGMCIMLSGAEDGRAN